MPRFKRLETLVAIERSGLIPVFFEKKKDVALEILKSCAKGGAKCIEMTNRGDGALDIFRELEEYCKTNLPKVILGAGSIVDAQTAIAYINLGANFIVGPVLDEETAIVCNKRKVPYSPGCGSVSEIQRAHTLGVEICKIFPGAEVGGPNFVKSVLGPCPWASLMPTGGVDTTKESLLQWFKSGVVCVGIGSNLITKEILNKKDFVQLERNIRNTLELIAEIRKNLRIAFI